MCRWCHNPETQSYARQLMVYSERCTGCGRCVSRCPRSCIQMTNHGVITDLSSCIACGECEAACAYGAREIAGQTYTVAQLVKQLMRDRNFYDNSGGGVTLSGGEPLAQDRTYLVDLLRALKERGIHTTVDTCGDVPWESIEAVLPYTDLFLYDLKAVDPLLHKKWTGRDNARILRNLTQLSKAGGQIHLRIPVIGGCNDKENEISAMIRVAERIKPIQVNLLPFHQIGRDKWGRLGAQSHKDRMFTPSAQWMEQLAECWRTAGFGKVEIGG